jgi:hypothetical protein
MLKPATGRGRPGPPMPKASSSSAPPSPEMRSMRWEDVYLIYDATAKRRSEGPRPNVPRHALQAF